MIFNRVVALSPATEWAAKEKVEAIQKASNWTIKTGCDEDTDEAMLKCLKEAPAENFTLVYGVDINPGELT